MSYAPHEIENLFGPMLIGTLLSMSLQGILFYQVYDYILKFPKDKIGVRYLVYYICFMEAVHTGYSMDIMFQPLILDNGKPMAVQTYPVLLVAGPAITVHKAAVSTPIQFFISWRIFCVQQSFYVPMTICVLSLISTGGAFATCVQTQRYKLFSERDTHLEIPVIIWMGFGAVCDILISVALSCTLYKRKTGKRTMDAILAKIIRLSMQTGISITFFAVLCVVTLVGLPTSLSVNYVFSIILVKLYANFLLASLNARTSWNGALEVVDESLLFNNSSDTDIITV